MTPHLARHCRARATFGPENRRQVGDRARIIARARNRSALKIRGQQPPAFV